MIPAVRAIARVLLATLLVATVALSARPTVAAPDSYLGIVSGLRDEIRQETGGQLSSYHMDVRLNPNASTISGRLRLRFVNAFDQALSDLAFRLYPNAPYYDEGALRVRDVRVGSDAVQPVYEADDTVMRLPLAPPLQPGDQATIQLRFETVIPVDSHGTYGIFTRDSQRGTWVLADWYPIVAGYEPGRGWRVDPPTDLGDPTFSQAALYDVAITTSTDLTVVATGEDVEETAKGDATTRRFVSGPAREFTLVIDDDYVASSTVIDGTRMTMFRNSGTGEDRAALALDAAAQALAAYASRYGPYPYTELDIVETELAGALGVSWAGIIFLDSSELLARPPVSDLDAQRFVFTVAHEVGHQWWGGTIGVNSNDYPFLVEGLTNYLAIICLADMVGRDVAHQQLRQQIVQPYLAAIEQYGDGVANRPATAPQDGPPNGVLIYGKAALGFLAIQIELGDDAFFAALRDLAEQRAFGVTSPAEMLRFFERSAGTSLAETWRFWFDAAEATPDDVASLLAQAA
jgi:aminopeptidase N